MDRLHARTGWTPGRASIRPSPEIIEKKHEFYNKILPFYESMAAYVYDTVFGLAILFTSAGKIDVARDTVERARGRKLLSPNIFPYCVPVGTRHYNMWYLCDKADLDDAAINADISEGLSKEVGGQNFEFVWYENPKMTVLDVYHVQVFWRLLEPGGAT